MEEDGITFCHVDCMKELITMELIKVYRINGILYRVVDAPAEFDIKLRKEKINWEEEGF